MKTYAISLKRSKRRWEYIHRHLKKRGLEYTTLHAVDGRELKEKDLEKYCDIKKVQENRKWLNNSAIGCALSHYRAYKEIAEKNLPCAFIVEDDVILPENIQEILSLIEQEIHENEIILLYSASFSSCKLSKIGSVKLGEFSLVYPVNIRQTLTATAYVISQKAAISLSHSIIPISVAADCWFHYYEKGALESLRLAYPSKIKVKNYKSSIEYVNTQTLLGKLLVIIDQFKIPIIYQLLQLRRRSKTKKMINHFILSDDKSPIMEKNHKNAGSY